MSKDASELPGLTAAHEKMAAADIRPSAMQTFEHYYRQLADGVTGMVAEEDIEPVDDIPTLTDVEITDEDARAALAKTVIIKLNGGLGTSMGLAGPKSLLEVRDGLTFLDVTVRQVLAARKQYDVRLPLVFMNSFATQKQTRDFLAKYPELRIDGLDLDFEQSQEPKLLADDLSPAQWEANPDLEWAPPGHGDFYPSIFDSGILDALLDEGFEYASVSNSDNLGAAPDARLAGWFAASGASFAMEVCRRTANDRKGGHLAKRREDDQLILREAAQTADEDLDAFQDINRHKFFNTNSLWLRLADLRDQLTANDGVMGLPMIVNKKTVDPSDSTSPQVIQIETAIGAAIEVFDGSQAIEVGRDRFVPVKKTNELLLLRSDIFELDDQTYRLVSSKDDIPEIDLDPDYYKLLDDFESRIPSPISLIDADAFKVRGDFRFEERVQVVGEVELDTDTPRTIGAGAILESR